MMKKFEKQRKRAQISKKIRVLNYIDEIRVRESTQYGNRKHHCQ
jgi:hypothetical protein